MTSRYALNRMRVMGELTVNRSLAFHLPPGGLAQAGRHAIVLQYARYDCSNVHSDSNGRLLKSAQA